MEPEMGKQIIRPVENGVVGFLVFYVFFVPFCGHVGFGLACAC